MTKFVIRDQEMLDRLLEEAKPETQERKEQRRAAQRILHNALDTGEIVLGADLWPPVLNVANIAEPS